MDDKKIKSDINSLENKEEKLPESGVKAQEVEAAEAAEEVKVGESEEAEAAEEAKAGASKEAEKTAADEALSDDHDEMIGSPEGMEAAFGTDIKERRGRRRGRKGKRKKPEFVIKLGRFFAPAVKVAKKLADFFGEHPFIFMIVFFCIGFCC